MSNLVRENKQMMDCAVKEYMEAAEKMQYISLGKLSEKYGFKRSTISKYIKLAGGIVVNRTNGRNFNFKVFEKIDTEEKAYWLGFLYADGCCTTTGHSVELGLWKKDIDHLKKYCKFLGLPEDAIHFSEGMARVKIKNAQLWTDLVNKGCVPKKSLILTFPKREIFSYPELIRHFIRGYCDGDGCLRFYVDHKGATNCALEFSGTDKFLLAVRDILGIRGGYFRNASTKKVKTENCNLAYRCVPARAVGRVLYENSTIYLDRKYEIFKSFCRFEEESWRVKSSKIGEGCDANPEVIEWMAKGHSTP